MNNPQTEEIKTFPGIKFYHPAFLVSTWFGIGKIPFAPGTWGSFFTFPLFILAHYLLAFASSEKTFTNLFLLLLTILFIVGNWTTNIYMKRTGKHDPKEVVIDEVVAQMLVFFSAFIAIAQSLGIFQALYGTPEAPKTPTLSDITNLFATPPLALSYIAIAVPAYTLCFILFRIFDIWKPWPISYCDKNMKGGFGVMFDDLFAAMYAIIVLYGIGLLISM